MKDWELHHARLWAHPSNARFAQLTKRVLDTPPPIQAFPPRNLESSTADTIVAVCLAAALIAGLAIF